MSEIADILNQTVPTALVWLAKAHLVVFAALLSSGLAGVRAGLPASREESAERGPRARTTPTSVSPAL